MASRFSYYQRAKMRNERGDESERRLRVAVKLQAYMRSRPPFGEHLPESDTPQPKAPTVTS